MSKLAAPVNIFSGADTALGAALTNPTELARQKGTLTRSYPVLFDGKRYPDAETAYQLLKATSVDPHRMMAEVICAKFQQHPDLAQQVADAGGTPWLATCSHLTQARSPGAQAWEGVGMKSRYIRILVEGYELFQSGSNTQNGQAGLF